MDSWVVTLPQSYRWEDYEKELRFAEEHGATLNFRMAYKPKAQVGDRCYVVWQGKIRGWMRVAGVQHYPEGFTCETTSMFWKPGWYLQRRGEFHHEDGPSMKGFRGIRRL